jgi:diguanylate cyclase
VVFLFASFAVITLIPVLLIGFFLSASYRSEADRRGLAEGGSEALLMAKTAIQPVLNGQPLSQGLTPDESAAMRRLVRDVVASHDVLRLRLRDQAGNVIFSDDGSGFHEAPEDEALDAARGEEVIRLTRFNSDSNDTGQIGPTSVEVYLPLHAGAEHRRVGVMEVYLPYAPIAADVDAGLSTLYRNLAICLALLYIVLFGISAFVGRRLRRQARTNAYLAEHDALTDLPNRLSFHARVESALRRGRETGQSTTVAIIDLDRFKEVNDTLGHSNGDRLLAALSERMASHLRGLDALARLGGDEFGVVLVNMAEPEDVLERLRNVIEHEVEISGLSLSVEASIGYVIAPQHGDDVDELLALADIAMYVAKAHHAGVVHYEPSQNHYDAANLQLIAELRHAVDNGELVLFYQPKVNLGDGRVTAVEALIRWQHPRLGLLSPDRFIPLAEQTGLIDRVTEWVVDRAVCDLGSWQADLRTAVNVSARNLGDVALVSHVTNALAAASVSPDRLYIEITETALVADPERAAVVLARLHDAGVRISIDDFGIGQTSLSYLSALPIDEIKIDQSFVADLTTNAGHRAIVRSVVDLGHNLGFPVVGEGVETQEIAAALADISCDVAQGYLYARPMPPELLSEWVAFHDRSTSLT